MRNLMTILIPLTMMLLCLGLPSEVAHALDSCDVPYGATYNIDEHSTCRAVTNNHASGQTIMVPTKTAAEWNSGANAFLNALPAGVTAAPCPAGGGACSHANPPTGVTLESTSSSLAVPSYASAASGDTIVYGDSTAASSVGRAYVYVRSGASWTLQATLAPADTPLRSVSPNFGSAVAIDGDVIVVGARGWDSTASGTAGRDNGAIYVFTRTGTTWTQRARFVGQVKSEERFGYGVTVKGDSLGGVTDDENGDFRARLFRRTGPTTFGGASGWIAVGKNTSDFRMAASGDTVLVCHNKCDATDGGCATSQDTGALKVYYYNGSAWALQATLKHSDPANNDGFCSGMDIDGDTIAAAAKKASPATAAGAVYIFTRSGTTWTQRLKFQPPDLAASDYFGQYIDLDGEVLAIGSYDDTGATDSGSIYIYTGSGATWTQRHKFQSPSPAASEIFRPIGLDAGRLYTTEGFSPQQFRSYVLNCGSGSPTSCAP